MTLKETLIDLVDKYRTLEAQIEASEEALKDAKARLEVMATQTIPTIMDAMGADTIERDGLRIKCEDILTARVADKSAAVTWLEANGYDSLVRYRLDFGKGSNVKEVVSELRAKGAEFEEQDEVHWQSLQKAVRLHIEEGGAYPPMEAIETRYFRRASIKEIK